MGYLHRTDAWLELRFVLSFVKRQMHRLLTKETSKETSDLRNNLTEYKAGRLYREIRVFEFN